VPTGDVVLVNGATGGVGAFAIQLAVDAGLEVIATARPGPEEEHVRRLGAGTTVDWAAGGVPDAVRAIRPDGVDGVIDLISRDATAFAAMAGVARPAGAAVSTLGAASAEIADGPRVANIHSAGDQTLLQRVADLAQKGAVRVPLVETVPFEQIDEAFQHLASTPLGKVGLTMSA
jgi:NADPH2:quinone reductase